MIKNLLMAMSATCAMAAPMQAQQALTIGDIAGNVYRSEALGGITMLTDGGRYAYVSDDGKRVEACDMKSGKHAATLFDAGNTLRHKVETIDGFEMSPDGTRMLVWNNVKQIYRRSFAADYYIYNIDTRVMEPLSGNGAQQSPVWSPDSRNIAFVRDNNIFLVRLLYDNAETQVTKDGRRNETINGLADWVNEEEFATEHALTFTSDGAMICWIRYDERQVKTYRLGDYEYKYPLAGETNSTVEVRSFDIMSKQTRTLQVAVPEEGYIPRIAPSGEDHLVVFTMNRRQDELCLWDVNTRSTVSRLLLKEKTKNYVKEEAMAQIVVDSTGIVMPSDRTGFMQLYHYNADGTPDRQLSDVKGGITNFYGYDAKTGTAYYQGIGRDPLNREVYATDRKGNTTCLTPREGWNAALMSGDYSGFVHIWSDADHPRQYSLCDRKGKALATLIDNRSLQGKIDALQLPKKEFFKMKTADGTELNGVMIRPRNFDTSKQYPVVMWQYSGPGSQQVVNSWSMGSVAQGCLFDYYLAQQGLIVVCVDGRGTGGRGSAFEELTYRHLGQLESSDQAEVARYLASLPYVDGERIGIWGWSFGGFNTLMAMSEGSGRFRSGVAVAPVTDWRKYDTIYTERYMRTPRENNGYDDNPITRASKLEGELLLIHGTADDNVHPENSTDYAEALVAADKDFSERFYKGRNHSIRGGNTRNHLLRQIARHFERTLMH